MPRVVTWLVSICACFAPAALVGPDERPDLVPQNVYWQLFPSEVHTVTIDRSGRPWFELDGSASVEQVKQQTEAAESLKAPWVRGARILLFDSAGRVWLTCDPMRLLAYDPHTRKWIERRPQTNDPQHAFTGPAIEDKSGRVFIADRAGCHVFDHGAWSYQPFYDLNIRGNVYFNDTHEFGAASLTRDDRGRIYAWTQWGANGSTGTLGFWVHEGTDWHQTMTGTGERPGHIAAVVPMGDSRVLVCPEAGKVSVARIDFSQHTDRQQLQSAIDLLGSASFRDRRRAERQILQLGPHVVPLIRQALDTVKFPEQRTRLELIIGALEQAPPLPMINDFALTNARYSGHDERGNIVLWSDTSGPDGRAGRTAAWLVTPQARVLPAPETLTEWEPHALLTDAKGRLYLAEYRQGLGVLDHGKLIRPQDSSDQPYDQILGEDAAGRVYVQNRWHIAALDLDAPDTRPALPVIAYERSASRASACQDSDGRTIAKLSSPGQAFLSEYRNGRFKEFPVPPRGRAVSDIAYLQPLSGGAIVAQEEPGKDVFYFDGSQWSVFRGLRELVEKRFHDLSRQIDNRHSGVQTYAALRADSKSNVWCVQWDHVDMYDGKRWRSYPADRAPVPRPILCCLPTNGGRMLVCDSSGALLLERADDTIKASPLPGVAPLPTNLNTGIDLWLDHAGRVWIPASDDAATVIDHDRAQTLAGTGLPRLDDSAGRIWFVSPSQKRLLVLDPTGHKTELAEPALSDDSGVIEDKPGSFWLTTRAGLRHLAFPPGASEPTPDRSYFEKGIPKGTCAALWLDSERALWFSGSGTLYRIKLP